MTYEEDLKQPTHTIARQLNMIIAKNPQIIYSFDQNKKHLSIGKYSHIPFSN